MNDTNNPRSGGGGEKYPPQRSSSTSAADSSSSASSSFLKIPRIRLKQKQPQKSSLNNSDNNSSLSCPSSATDRQNNKFSYIENSHLVNPVMIQQQQQKIIGKRQQQQQQLDKVTTTRSDGEEEEENDEVVGGGGGGSGGKSNPNKVLIKPKKLPNPIKESVAMQSIHRELLLNQKIGRSVLTHKTELQKALEKLATKNEVNEQEQDQRGPNPPSVPPPIPILSNTQPMNKNEFQRILEQRAKQIEEQKCFVDGVTKHPVIRESEFEKIHKRITAAAASVQK